ncbi:unnamed protein product [Brugia timori]|uniref:Uncharacterized protein n=1 Tax=Brugia timori TaxID=42155 RepID=A0A0R3RCX3_9BILA|nr:unnamed protein product [Brugia timori]
MEFISGQYGQVQSITKYDQVISFYDLFNPFHTFLYITLTILNKYLK